MKSLKHLFIFFIVIMTFVYAACSNNADDDDDEETVLTEYSYNTTNDGSYCRVYEFHCVDNSDGTYKVKDFILHYFLMSDERYKLYSGTNLLDMVQNGTVLAEAISDTIVENDDKQFPSTNSTTGTVKTYIISAGTSYKYYHYGLPTHYIYNLQSSDTYAFVQEFHSFYNGDYEYRVRQHISHRFSKALYGDKTGSELVNIVKEASITPSLQKTYTRTEDGKMTVNGSAYYYSLPAGLKYQAYYYE